MKGIKSHSHGEREKIVQKLIPLIRDKFRENFVALAADGSFARGEDVDYSDLELIVFVHKIPKDINWNIGKIIDGLLIEIVVETKESYIQKYLDISGVWYASGTGGLFPVVNKDFIDEINNFKPADVEIKTLRQIQKKWNNFQEITAKLLNNIKQNNKNGIALIFSDMFNELLTLLAYLNRKPYKTLGKYITDAKHFSIKPEGFDELTTMFINGKYTDINKLKELTEKVFSSFEKILDEKRVFPYEVDIKELVT